MNKHGYTRNSTITICVLTMPYDASLNGLLINAQTYYYYKIDKENIFVYKNKINSHQNLINLIILLMEILERLQLQCDLINNDAKYLLHTIILKLLNQLKQ